MDREKVERILKTFVSRTNSPTNEAMMEALGTRKVVDFQEERAFNSARKWSALAVDGQHYVLGAPEIVLAAGSAAAKRAAELAGEGKRVLAMVTTKRWLKAADKPAETSRPVALAILREKVRSDAAETLDFFRSQDVAVKVISGDSPLTVAAVAKAVGFKNVREFDARSLPVVDMAEFQYSRRAEYRLRNKAEAEHSGVSLIKTEKKAKKSRHERELSAAAQQFLDIIQNHNVFGRVQPEQKRMIAAALKFAGQTVAMTGDGVNDALALKEADLGIAMNSGAPATRAVAEVVLMDSRFEQLPQMVSEGRRVIANIERVANLFVIKNVYAAVLAIAVSVAHLSYPYLPVQMSVISALSIGVPAFFLALAPNSRPFRAGFLRRVLAFALPVGVIAAMVMLATEYWLFSYRGFGMEEVGTAVSIVVMMIGVAVLLLLARPWRKWKLTLIGACAGVFVVLLATPGLADIFSYRLNVGTLLPAGVIGAVAIGLVILVDWIVHRPIK
jgi:cation-transporting ATPase E